MFNIQVKLSMKLLLVSLFILSYLYTSGQLTLEAQILDFSKKTPVSFATVQVKGSFNGVQSDINGRFSLSCLKSDTIIFRCVGYKQQFVPVDEAISTKIIELDKDIVELSEISVSVESAYKMLFRARDSTAIHQKKSLSGLCLRQDLLLFNKQEERKSDSEIIFRTKNINSKKNKIDYWLKSTINESFGKISKQPYMAYPNTIPLNIFSVRSPSEDEKLSFKCTMDTSNINQLVITTNLDKPTKSLVRCASYYINNNTWLIDSVEYWGVFNEEPIKKWNNYHYKTNVKIVYDAIKDSCMLKTFNYKLVFSHKKADPEELWSYSVSMKILEDSKIEPMESNKKLGKNDYLLFKAK